MSNELNVKQMKFIDNLFQGMGQRNAYVGAGYTEKTADQGACQLLRNTKIQEEIKRRLIDIEGRNRIRLGRISETALKELLSILGKGTPDDRVRLDAVKDALDRAGLKPVEKIAIGGDKELEPLTVIIRKRDK